MLSKVEQNRNKLNQVEKKLTISVRVGQFPVKLKSKTVKVWLKSRKRSCFGSKSRKWLTFGSKVENGHCSAQKLEYGFRRTRTSARAE